MSSLSSCLPSTLLQTFKLALSTDCLVSVSLSRQNHDNMLHHSCARCRERKIRCDGKSPCTHCISSNVPRHCKRMQRKQRRRKISTFTTSVVTCNSNSIFANASDVVTNNASSSNPANSNHSNLMAGIAQPLFHHSSTSSISDRTDSPSAISDLNGLNVHTEQSAATNTISPTNSCTTNVTSNFAITSSDTSQEVPAKEQSSLFEEARLVIGDHDAAQSVIDVQYYYRCSGFVGSCVHIPSLKRTLNSLFLYPAASSSSAESVGEASLAVLLLALALSIQFTPRGMYEKSQLEYIDALGPDLSPVERQHSLHSLAKAILQRLMFNSDASLAQVQACIMVVVYDLDDSGFKDGMLWNAVSCAERLRMDHVSSTEEVTVENEMKVRAWWWLVTRDWFMAPKKGGYRINPLHFTTRLPLVIRDVELEKVPLGITPSEVLQERNNLLWLPMRTVPPLIELASLVRKLVDEKFCPDGLPFDKVEQAYIGYLNRLPLGFRLKDTYVFAASPLPPGRCAQRFSIERWMVHQIILVTMLEFYEVPQPISEPVSPIMLALANHILDLQGRIRHHCEVVDSLKVNVDGVLRASILICLDLIYQSTLAFGKNGEDGRATTGNGLVRQITLGRVKEAIYRCRHSKSVKADTGVVEGLLQVEERCWNQRDGEKLTEKDFPYVLDLMPQGHASSAPITSAPVHAMRSAAGSLAMASSPPYAFDVPGTGGSMSNALPMAGDGNTAARLVPSDSGFCSALQADSDVADKFLESVMAFLDKPVEVLDQMS